MNAQTQTRLGYDEASQAIADGLAEAQQLWLLLTAEDQRNGYAIRPLRWEGSGEYQRVRFLDGRDGLVRLPDHRPLPNARSEP